MTFDELPSLSRFSPSALDMDLGNLRTNAPVSRITTRDGSEAWLVTRYDDVKFVLADPRFSVSLIPLEDRAGQGPERSLFQDPPGHTRLRRLVAKAFAESRVEAMRTRAEQVAAQLVEAMASSVRPRDIVEAIAFPLPITMICDILGIPEPDRQGFRSRSDVLLAGTGSDQREAFTAWMDLNRYVAQLIDIKRNDHGEDLISICIEAQRHGEDLSDEEMVTMIVGLPIAGYVSTANAIAIATIEIVGRGQLVRLRDKGARHRAVEEVLRYQSGINAESMPRMAIEDVNIAGTLVRAGDVVVAPLCSANRDETVFDDPDRFDLTRHRNPHVAFGHGIHRCLGKALARIELEVVLSELALRLPSLRLVNQSATRPTKLNLFGDNVPCEVMVEW
ncbi:cytochrome P450 [Antrihabitans spumae]|uniref:Cytochrome P450 n=1 Tax=Antrihabitans spumae TaxID=3373370 RepID=A0ABW7KWX0_9NOCA